MRGFMSAAEPKLAQFMVSVIEACANMGDRNRAFILAEQMRAMKRFNIEIKTFFLAAKINNGIDDVPMIWKVQFDDNPEFEMEVPTRQDLWTGELTFIEV